MSTPEDSKKEMSRDDTRFDPSLRSAPKLLGQIKGRNYGDTEDFHMRLVLVDLTTHKGRPNLHKILEISHEKDAMGGLIWEDARETSKPGLLIKFISEFLEKKTL